MTRPQVEILYFEGCPNHAAVRALVERIATELQINPAINDVEVADPDAAVRLHFLGSPSVRVNGRDVEPGADERSDYVLSCRVYCSERGLSGQPEERWVRESLTEAAP
jgi:hypothetical protein